VKKLVAVLGAVLLPMVLLVGSAGAGGEPEASSSVALSGTPVTGTALRVVPATWSAAPDARSYEWLRDGEGDVLSRATTYTTTRADVGHTLVVVERVTFGPRQDETSSAPVAVGVAPPAAPAPAALAAPSAVVSGSSRVGGQLRVALAGGTPGASTAVQWQRDGSAIPGATGQAYTLTRSDAGRTMTVRTTSSLSGRPTVTGGSTAARVPAVNTRRPTIKKVGQRLKVRSKGTWFAPGHTYRYQWLRGGKKIPHATKSSYRITKKDRRKKLSVRVEVRRPGFPAVRATSSRTSIK
jgi:hypothetical protein